MPRIHYVISSDGGLTGGQKMCLRHVETLRELGFDADGYLTNKAPARVDHDAPLVTGRFDQNDIFVAPDDEGAMLLQCAQNRWRTVVFAQNPYMMARTGLPGLDALSAAGALRFMAVAPRLERTLRRLYPDAEVHRVRCFADERRFGPRGAKEAAIAFTPRKRRIEAPAIEGLFRRLHPEHAALEWRPLKAVTETEVADTFARSSLFLSLNHLESVGMTPLEAMASGCLCAGFLGVGGEEYATPDNGFWVPNEDCEAAADALAEAAAVAAAGGPELARRVEAGFETARAWSHAVFRRELEDVWSRLAPDARTL